MENSPTIYGDNFAAARVVQEGLKYGRLPTPELAAHPHVYNKHSIEPAYGGFDAPSSEVI